MTGHAKRIGDIAEIMELPELDYYCERHGPYTGKSAMMRFGKMRQTIDPPCPQCEAEKKEEEERQNEREIMLKEEAREEKRIAAIKKMNIGKKFWHESFETFDPYTPELRHHLDACRAFAGKPEGRMLIMLGNNGNGKDHLAASMLQYVGGYVYSVFEIELLLKRCYSGKTSEWGFYRRLCEAPLLVINEIGKHKQGNWELNFISYIINKRYENMMPVVLISNKHLKEQCPNKGCEDCFQNYLGNDVLSRITEGGKVLLFTGEDYRVKIREKKFMEKGENYVC